MKSAKISFRAPRDMHERLDELVAKTGLNKSTLIIQAIEAGLDKADENEEFLAIPFRFAKKLTPKKTGRGKTKTTNTQ